jgi:plastocyanin
MIPLGSLWLRLLVLVGLGATALLGSRTLLAGAQPAPRRHVVEIKGMAFDPAVLEVTPGDSVVWINRDIVPHTATAKSQWDTGPIAQGGRGVFVSRRRGEITYVCAFHPTMQGRLITR